MQLLEICASENGLLRTEPQAHKTWVLQYSAPWKRSADQDLDFCCFRRSLTSQWPVKSWQCWLWPTAYRTWRSGWEEWWWPVTEMDSLWQQTTWYVHLRSSRELKVPDLPHPGTEPRSPELQANSWLSEPPGATCNQENESLLHVTGYNGNFCSHLFLLKVPIILNLMWHSQAFVTCLLFLAAIRVPEVYFMCFSRFFPILISAMPGVEACGFFFFKGNLCLL